MISYYDIICVISQWHASASTAGPEQPPAGHLRQQPGPPEQPWHGPSLSELHAAGASPGRPFSESDSDSRFKLRTAGESDVLLGPQRLGLRTPGGDDDPLSSESEGYPATRGPATGSLSHSAACIMIPGLEGRRAPPAKDDD